MKSYLERARIARAVKVRVMNEWGLDSRFDRPTSLVRGTSRNETKNGFDGNRFATREAPNPGPQFLGNRLEPAT